MTIRYNIMILGASYGSLLGMKLAMAGHAVKLVCLPEEARLINEEGARVQMPVKGVSGLIEFNSQEMPGKLSAGGPAEVSTTDYDLVALAMQEPQYQSPDVRELLSSIADAKIPCMSIMNMPPLTYLERIPGIDIDACKGCYTDSSVWDELDPSLMTLCSPDPQAFRPPDEKINVLRVGLPTNFKAARFESDKHTAILRQLESDIDAIRYNGQFEVPVKLRVHESIFVPLAKWCMLLTGNYRCIHKEGIRSIKEAVHSDLDQSRSVYNWVVNLCISLGSDSGDLVPFDKYANAAMSLENPSSVARALAAGAVDVERVDHLVQVLASGKGMASEEVNQKVALVDHWLDTNRRNL